MSPTTPTPQPTIAQLRGDLASGTTTPAEAVRRSAERLKAVDGSLHAFLQTFDGTPRNEGGPLAGVPVALKDNICLDFGRTTCGCRMLERYESPFTATAAKRLIDAGAVVVGKTNLDEFAMGSSGENSAFGPTKNPWDLSRVPGGSSSGSAAAVAAGIVPLALGSDTGGSIRQPAAFCGIVGIKPTYGRVSRYGLVAYASSLDQIGPLTRTVEDAAIALSVICGQDPLDATSSSQPVPDFAAGLGSHIHHLKLGVPRQARSEANHAGVSAAFEEAIRTYAGLGATIIDLDMPLIDAGVAAYYIVAPAEASSNLARFDGIRYGRRAELKPGEGLEELYCRSRSEFLGKEVQRRIMLGTHVLSAGYADAYYNTALKVRRRIKGEFDAAFAQGCHAILMPTAPNPAWKIGAKDADPMSVYLEDIYTVPVNLAGLPAISIPCGLADEGGKKLPVGLQLVGRAFDESTLLAAAAMFEKATPWAAMRPPV